MTILGEHTAAELDDLLAAKDYDLEQVEKARAAFHWTDNEANKWDADWKTFRKRYDSARLTAKATIAAANMVVGVRNTLIPAESAYQGMLRALTAEDGHYTDTDFQGLHNRLVAAQGKPVDFPNQPQPKASDVDLNVYKQADSAINKGEAATKKAATSKTVWIIGGVATGLFALHGFFSNRR